MTTKKPSAVAGLRRGVGTAAPEDPHHDADLPTANPYLEADRRNASPPRPPKPVRFTLDLDREHHQFLKTFAVECGAGVHASDVVRALLDELREGANLPTRVRARIWAEKK